MNTQKRRRKYSIRGIFDTILYLLKTGCQWRMLPSNFAAWQSVYYYFSKWKNESIIEKLLSVIHSNVHKQLGKAESPSLGVIDSRSVKTYHHVDSDRGIDGHKKIKGRKQHVIVYTLGLPMAVAVHEANIHDSKGALQVIDKLAFKFPPLIRILADGGYRGTLADWILDKFGWELEIVLRLDECLSKFQVLPKHWIVERSFAWLENFRRLTIDYEYYAETAVTLP